MNAPQLNMVVLFLLLFNGFCLAENAVTPGELDVDPPTLIGLGFEWWVSGDDNENAALQVEYRRQGARDWEPALAPVYHRGRSVKSFAFSAFVDSHFAGSIIDLEADTPYEVRLTLSDPDGVRGEGVRVFRARTRKVPEPYEGGRKLEVFPDGSGLSLESVLPRLRPGDCVLMHAGEYTPPPFEAPPSPESTGGTKAQPWKGQVRHVYPPGYKGEKKEPNFPSLMEAYHGAKWLYDVQFMMVPGGVQPGDTILLHAGHYQTQRLNYRYLLSMWQHGTYRFTRKGTAEKPITIKAAGDGPVILDGGGAYRMLDFLGGEHHIVEGLTIQNAFIGFHVGAPEKGLQAEGLAIQDCEIKDVRAAILGSEGSDIRIVDTSIQEGAFPDRREGTYLVTADGTSAKPIAITAFGDGEVVIDGGDNSVLFDVMAADHLILQDLTFRNTFTAVHAGRRGGQGGSRGLTVKNCRFEDIQNGVFGLAGGCRSFTILDNVFLGRQGGGNPGGYAVNLCGAGHAVGYNYSAHFWDHLNVSTSSTPLEGNRAWSMDFYNNACVRARDNMFEADGTMWNTRFMRNLCAYSNSFAFSSQPTLVGPSYYIRNILYRGGGFKFVMGTRGAYAYHNTLIGRSGIVKNKANNLFMEQDEPREIGFETFENVPEPDWENYPRESVPVDVCDLGFSLVEGSPAIDGGTVIPGLNEDYAGEAPDLGALEKGKPVPHYGPRTQQVRAR